MFRFIDNRVDTDFGTPFFFEQGRDRQNCFDRSHIIRRTDNHRFTCINRTFLERSGIGDLGCPADDPEIFWDIQVLTDTLLHFFPLHLIGYDNALFGTYKYDRGED